MSSPETEGAIERLRQQVVDVWRAIDGAQYDRCVLAWEKYEALGLSTRLTPVTFIESLYPVMSFRQRHEALCLWLGVPFPGIPELWTPAMEKGILPKDYLAPVPSPPSIEKGTRLGDIFVAIGAATPGQRDRLLELQRTLARRTGVRLLFGMLGVNQSILTAGEYMHALALQVGLPFERFELEQLEQITQAVNERRRNRLSVRMRFKVDRSKL